jgi:hypothetical protein
MLAALEQEQLIAPSGSGGWSWAARTAATAASCLTACAERGHDVQAVHEHHMVGDENFVTVQDARSAHHPASWAELWCARNGKTAHFMSAGKHHHGRYVQTIDIRFECMVGPHTDQFHH